MQLFRKKTTTEYAALSPEAQLQYRREMAEYDIRQKTSTYSRFNENIEFNSASTDGLPAAMSNWRYRYRSKVEMQLELIKELKADIIAKIKAEREALGITPETDTVSLAVSVAKYGSRYIWAIGLFGRGERLEGFPEFREGEADTQEAAWKDAETAARQFVEDCKGLRLPVQGAVYGLWAMNASFATDRFRKINREKQRSRPGKGGKEAHETKFIIISNHGVYLHRIIKETKKQIRYQIIPSFNLDGSPIDGPRKEGDPEACGVINKEKAKEDLDNRGWASLNNSHLYYAHAWLMREQYDEYMSRGLRYEQASLEQLEKDLIDRKTKMFSAHPDKGGSEEAFIAARKEYEMLKTNIAAIKRKKAPAAAE